MFDWISEIMRAMGAFGVGLLMFIENVFPPIPSELVMPLAGFLASRGVLALWLLIVAGSIGSVAGAVLWYWVGRKLGADRLRALTARHGRWLGMHPSSVDRAQDWFERHGGAAVLFGRLIPTVRTLISVPAGINRMPIATFLGYTTIGAVAWTGLLAGAGYALSSQYDLVAEWLNPVSWCVVAVLLGTYLWRVITFDPDQRSGKAQSL